MTIKDFKKSPAMTKKYLEKLKFFWIEQDPVEEKLIDKYGQITITIPEFELYAHVAFSNVSMKIIPGTIYDFKNDVKFEGVYNHKYYSMSFRCEGNGVDFFPIKFKSKHRLDKAFADYCALNNIDPKEADFHEFLAKCFSDEVVFDEYKMQIPGSTLDIFKKKWDDLETEFRHGGIGGDFECNYVFYYNSTDKKLHVKKSCDRSVGIKGYIQAGSHTVWYSDDEGDCDEYSLGDAVIDVFFKNKPVREADDYKNYQQEPRHD